MCEGKKQCTKCGEWKLPGNFYKRGGNICKECTKAKSREYARRPETKQRRKDRNNTTDINLHRREYRRRPVVKAKKLASDSNRRARKQSLPATLTADQWQHALNYFNGCCAACGRQLNDMFGEFTAAMDHWIPLSYEGNDNPGTVATNIIPLCHGVGGCNNSKYTAIPSEWIEREFGKRKAKKITARVQAYFDSLL